MIHVRNTAIANPAVMRIVWLVGLTHGTHGMVLHALGHERHGRGRNRPRIRQHGLGVAGPQEGGQRTLRRRGGWIQMPPPGQHEHGRPAVGNQQPDDERHERASLVRVVEPDAVGLARPTRALPRRRVAVRGVVVR